MKDGQVDEGNDYTLRSFVSVCCCDRSRSLANPFHPLFAVETQPYWIFSRQVRASTINSVSDNSTMACMKCFRLEWKGKNRREFCIEEFNAFPLDKETERRRITARFFFHGRDDFSVH